MRKILLSAAVPAAALGFTATGTQVSEAKVQIFIGPLVPQTYAPVQTCRWETRRGPCYVDTVCVRRNKRGFCKRFKRQKVCERRQVRVCY